MQNIENPPLPLCLHGVQSPKGSTLTVRQGTRLWEGPGVDLDEEEVVCKERQVSGSVSTETQFLKEALILEQTYKA